MLDIDYPEPEYPYPEDAGYFYCACDQCNCDELVEYPDQLCPACEIGDHVEEEDY